MAEPVETKVKAAGGTALLAGFLVSYLVVSAPWLSGLAGPLQAVIIAALTSASTYGAGYRAKHTPRGIAPMDMD